VKYKRIFIDANVLVDLFDQNRPSYASSKKALMHAIQNDGMLFTSCDIVTTVYYLMGRSADKARALAALEQIQNLFTLIPFANTELQQAVRLMKREKEYVDLEDTIQYVLAKSQGCDLILTNDLHFVSKKIKPLTAETFCREEGL
jgi:hypothetical protein